jgi:hypothetical protein
MRPKRKSIVTINAYASQSNSFVSLKPMGFRNLANKIFVNSTFANGESPLYFRQYISWNFANWRKSTVLSPIYPRTFAIDESPIGESLMGERPATPAYFGC